MIIKQKPSTGFTIVELLIVIVVIGILAVITVVAFRGIQDRANDTSIKSDLNSIAKKFELFKIDNSRYPFVNNDSDPAGNELRTLDLKVSRNAYGNGFAGGVHNLLYCRTTTDSNPIRYALIASSKSGKVFTYRSDDRQITESSAWGSDNSMTLCSSAGIPPSPSTDRDIFYLHSAWKFGV